MSDLTTTFTNIANAIRSKTGSSDTMTPSEMPDEIAEIETPMDSINITQNGTYEPSAGRGYNQVVVNVPLPQNAKLITTAENYPITDAADYPLPKCEVTVANADKCEVIVTSDNAITENNAPYLYRAIPSGNKALNELVGGTVAWNQKVNKNNFISSSDTDVTITDNRDGTLTVDILNTISTRKEVYITPNNSNYYFKLPRYHVFAMLDTKIISGVNYRNGYNGATIPKNSLLKQPRSSDGNILLGIELLANTQPQTFTVQPMIIDITQMFGTTIADYIYSLEQATAGSGIAWLKSYGFFAEDYYPYNAGKLMSVKTSARKVYDSDSNLLATYPLSNIELRGIPKLVNNQLVYDGDKYEGNGRVTRKFIEITYDGSSDENWARYSSGSASAFTMVIDLPQAINYTNMALVPPIECNYLVAIPQDATWGNYNYFVTMQRVNSLRMITGISTITTVEAWRTYLSNNPMTIIYESATSTTEQTSPYDNPQLAGSTEEFVDTREVAIPVGHESKYFNGEGYITYLEPNTSDTIDMAQEHAIMPLETTYISANGTLDVEYWK